MEMSRDGHPESLFRIALTTLFDWHYLGESSGSAVDAARRAGYPWTEQISRKLSRKVRETRSSSSQKRSERDSKCWQRVELGIHGLRSWGRNRSRRLSKNSF